MRVTSLLALLLGSWWLLSCDSPLFTSPDTLVKDDEEQIAKILYDGDTAAYNQFYDHWIEVGMPDRCLAYSIVMANKYHYAPAAYHVYEIFTSLYSISPSPTEHSDPEVEELRQAIADVDSAIAVVTSIDPSLGEAISSIDEGLDNLDPETRRMALTYFGRSLF